MNSKSDKRRALEVTIEPWLQKLRALGRCEFCGSEIGLQVHEVSGGPTRIQERGEPFSTVLLCSDMPHSNDHGCHQIIERLPKADAVAIALCLIRRSRPQDYRIEAFFRLQARRWPSEKLIAAWWRILNR